VPGVSSSSAGHADGSLPIFVRSTSVSRPSDVATAIAFELRAIAETCPPTGTDCLSVPLR